MLAIFASAAAEGEQTGLFHNPLVLILMVLIAIYVFVKFCSWAKTFQLSGQLKKWMFILTGIGVVFFNILYSQGNSQIIESGNWGGATTALLASLAWVFVFAFVLMAETKTD
ncbi:MAG: hypothetical protein CVU90_01405 [Firmicutes bacterium HGW-Firmicutes-15]|nr:MAG: hypothetical protein CVU90_01405 [Firmicutes bacterium HGW-Firmicutes-15]